MRNRLLGFLILLTGCGYHSNKSERPTLSIPYVRNDERGFLTNALILEINRSGLYEYVKSSSEYRLKVSLVSQNDEVIGFRYDRKDKTKKIEQNLMATENRKYATAEVVLYRTGQEEPVLGPVTMTATSDFDYVNVNTLSELAFVTPSGKLTKVIDFSQGQLDSVEGAQDNALTPAFSQLARQIVAFLQKAYFDQLTQASNMKKDRLSNDSFHTDKDQPASS